MSEASNDTDAQDAAAPQSEDNDIPKVINIKVKDYDNHEVYFKIKRNIPLGKLINAYYEKRGATPNTLRFLFDGVRVTPDLTAMDLEMGDNDMISVFCEQRGGREGSVAPDHEHEPEQESEEAKGDQYLTVIVKRSDHTGTQTDEVEFKVKRKTPMAKLMAAYEKLKDMKPGTLTFSYGAKFPQREDTAASLKMIGDSVIDVLLDGTGG